MAAPHPTPSVGADQAFEALLTISFSGVVLYTPLYDEAGAVHDFAFARLNPVAQHLLQLPPSPSTTYRQQFAAAPTDHGWAFHRDTFLAGTPATSKLHYYLAGHDRYFRMAGQRVGDALLVSLTETNDPLPGPENAPADHTMSQQLQAFDTVLASLQEYVYLFDLTGRFRYVNKPLLDLWGIPLEQAIGKNFFDLAYPEELATILQAQIREVIETQQPVQGATAYTSPAGAVGEYEYLFVPLLASDGSVESVAGRTQPVTERRRAEAALRASEAKYRLLFDSIDEGFCVIEVLFDAANHPYDYRFLEVNQAFEQQTGLVNVVGRTIRELAPQHEQHWFDSYGRVALTGEPIRFEDQAQQLHRWYDVYAFRIGEPAQCQVAVLFNDITSRKQTELAQQWQEKRQAFLLQLSDRLRPLSDATEVQYQAACALGEYLGADRVGYAEDQADSETIVVTRNYTHGVASIEGRYRYDDYGPELLRAFRAGQTVVRPDIANDPTLGTAEKEAHAVLQLGATVNIPLLKNGQLVAVLFMHYRQAHAWSEDELALFARNRRTHLGSRRACARRRGPA